MGLNNFASGNLNLLSQLPEFSGLTFIGFGFSFESLLVNIQQIAMSQNINRMFRGPKIIKEIEKIVEDRVLFAINAQVIRCYI